MRFLDKHIKKIFRVFGIIGLLISIYFLVCGVICLLRNSTTKDSEGFYSTWTIQIKKDSYAIVLRPDGIDLDLGWEMLDLKAIKVEGSNNNPSN